MKNLLRKMDGWTSEMRIITKHKTKKALLDIKSLALKAPIASIVFIVALVFTMAFSSYLIFASTEQDSVTINDGTNNITYTRYTVNKDTENNHGYLYLGSYPKTEIKKDDPLYDTLLGTNSTNGAVFEYGGEKYLCEQLTVFATAENYPHYFKFEPIKWEILNIKDGKYAVLLSNEVVDSHLYDSQNANPPVIRWNGFNGSNQLVAGSNGTNAYPMLRLYLNSYDAVDSTGARKPFKFNKDDTTSLTYSGLTYTEIGDAGIPFEEVGFFEKAFSDEEKGIIVPDTNRHLKTSEDGEPAKDSEGNFDKVRLLSNYELYDYSGDTDDTWTYYGFASSASTEDAARKAVASDYSLYRTGYWNYGKLRGSDVEKSTLSVNGVDRSTLPWWTMSRYYTSVYGVGAGGRADDTNYGNVYYLGVRPSITIDLSNLKLISGNGTSSNAYLLSYPDAPVKYEPYYKHNGDNGYVYYGRFPKSLADGTAGLPSWDSSHDGETFKIGNDEYLYELDKNSAGHWYKIEPIKWQILEVNSSKNSILLWSESVLESRIFDSCSVSTHWGGYGGGVDPNDSTKHQYPTLRLYLNGYDTNVGYNDNSSSNTRNYSALKYSDDWMASADMSLYTKYYDRPFIDKAFSSSERGAMLPTLPQSLYGLGSENENDFKNFYGEFDKVRMMGRCELSTNAFTNQLSKCVGARFGFSTYTTTGLESNRVGFTTPYSESKLTDAETFSNTYYSSTGRNSQGYYQLDRSSNTLIQAVRYDGDAAQSCLTRNEKNGVRPVIELDISRLEKTSGKGSITDPYMLSAGPASYTITAKVNDGEGSRGSISSSDLEGTGTLSGTFTDGDEVTITATANEGFAFDGWYKNGTTLVSGNKTYTFSPSSSMNLVAKFIEVQTINGTEYTKWFEKGSGGVSHGYVYLGSYPQRLATAEEIAAVEAIYTSTARSDVPHVVEDGPYAGTYMRANLFSTGAKWYKFEPIKWRILKADKTNNKLILLSDNVLERYRYSVDKNTSYKPNYTVYWYGPYTSNSKAYPWLRNYLNSYDNTSKGDSSNYYYISDRIIQPVEDWNSTYSVFQGFLNTAFTETDRIALIPESSEYKLASKDGTNNQADKVRLLSYEELYDNASNGNIGSSYGFNSTITTTGLDSNRIAFGTDYSLAGDTATGSYVDPRDGKTKTSQKWWTTSWGSMVNQNGAGETGYTTYSLLFGVRPVVTLDLSIANVLEGNEGGDGTFENPYAFDTTPNFNIEIDTNDILFENKGTISSSQLTGDDKDLTGLIRMYSNITINAQASDGYTFDGWYKDNETLLSTNSTYTFEVKDNTSITAKFIADETLDDGHTISKYYQLDSNGDSHGYIYYGTYPQRLATEEETAVLEAKYPYASTAVPITLDEGEYAGTYTNENINSTGFKWYKFEPIKWRILKVDKENNRLVLLSDSVIDFNRFWIDTSSYTPAYYKTWWGASTSENTYPWIRIFLNSYTSSGTYTEGSTKKYLTSNRTISTFTNTTSLKNRGFYNVAFSETEKMAIISEKNEYKDNTKDGSNTNQKDFVRLLSYEELYDNTSNGNIGSSYGFASDMSQTGLDTNRIAFGTDYSSAGTNKPNVEMVDPRDGQTKKAMEWWTLSNGWSIKVDGSGYSNSSYKENEGVRPVITIDLSKAYILDGAKGGDGTFSNPYVLDTTPKYEIDVDTNNGILESKGTISSNELDGDSKHLNKDIRMYEYVTLNAQVNDGYVFDGWYKDGENLLNTNLTYTFEVRDNTNITAKFSEAITLENGNEISKYYQTDSDGVSHGYVTFGSFPQRLATSEEIAAITAKVTSPSTDIPYEIESGPYKGKYQFSSVNNSGNRWYKYEPIVWRVLNADVENNKVILLSDSVLESYRFGAYEKTSDTNLAANKVFWWQPGSNHDDTRGKEYPWLRIHLNSYDNWRYGTNGGCNWYLSNLTIQSRSIYAGRNEGFYNIAFSDEEQAAIISESNAYKNASIDGSYNQTDKVRMLSIGELYDNADNGNMGSSFGFAADLTATGVETNRVAFGTDYSLAGYQSTTIECVDPRDGKTKLAQEYWTISFHSSGGWNNASPYFYTIYSNGAASNLHNENATSGVRPVITVDLDSVTKTKGVGSFASPYALSTGTDEIYIEELVSDGEINYFPDGYIDENGTLHNGEGDVEVVSLNDDSELKAYVYRNGMAVFEGTDNKEVEVPNSKKSAITKVAVSNNGFAPKSTESMLKDMINLESADLKELDGTNLDDMSKMFDGCENLEKVEFPQDLDTTKVEDFSEMFKDCSSLETLNLDSFTIKDGATTTDMFSGCTSLEKINVPLSVDRNSEPDLPVISGSSWSAFKADDTKLTSVTSLPGKNKNASFSYVKAVAPQLIYTDPDDSSKKYYDSDALYTWDISKAGEEGLAFAYYFETGNTNSDGEKEGELVFYSNSDDVTISFDGNFSGYEFGEFVGYSFDRLKTDDSDVDDPLYYKTVLNKSRGFVNINNDAYQPWQLLETYDEEHTITKVIFANEIKLPPQSEAYFALLPNVTEFKGIENLDTSEVLKYIHMFWGLTKLEELDLSHFSIEGEVYLYGMFEGCVKLDNLDFSSFNKAEPVDFGQMFANCTSLSSVDLSMIDTSYVESMRGMFKNCINLTSLNISNWNTESCYEFDTMFVNCNSLTELDLSHFDFDSSSARFNGMFASTPTLLEFAKIAEGMDIEDLDELSDINYRAYSNEFSLLEPKRDSSLNSINLWETEMSGEIRYLFYGLGSLEELDLSHFTLENYSLEYDYEHMLDKCSGLKKIILPSGTPEVGNVTLPTPSEDSTWRGNDNSGPYVYLPKAEDDLEYVYLKSSIIEIGEGTNKKQFKPSDALYTWDISSVADSGDVIAYYFNGNENKDGNATTRTYDGELLIVPKNSASVMREFNEAAFIVDGNIYGTHVNTGFDDIIASVKAGNYNTTYQSNYYYFTPWSVINANGIKSRNGEVVKSFNFSDDVTLTNGNYLFCGLSELESIDLDHVKESNESFMHYNYMFAYLDLDELIIPDGFGQKEGTFTYTFLHSKIDELQMPDDFAKNSKGVNGTFSSFETANLVIPKNFASLLKTILNDESGVFTAAKIDKLNISEGAFLNTASLYRVFEQSEIEEINFDDDFGSKAWNLNSLFVASKKLKRINDPDPTDDEDWVVLPAGFSLDDSSELNSLKAGSNKTNYNQTIGIDAGWLFKDCTSIKKIDLSNMSFWSIYDSWYNASEALNGCMSLDEIKLPKAVDDLHPINLPSIKGMIWKGYNGDTEEGTVYKTLPAKVAGTLDRVKLVPNIVNVNGKDYNLADALYAWDLSKGTADERIMCYYFAVDQTKGYDGEMIFTSTSPDNEMMNFDYQGTGIKHMFLDINMNKVETITQANYQEYLINNRFRSDNISNTYKSFDPWSIITMFEESTNPIKHIYVASPFKITKGENLFNGLEYVEDVDLSKLNVGSCNTIKGMFEYMSRLKSIDLSTWTTANITNFTYLFDNDKKLESVDISSWTINKETSSTYSYFFNGCSSLTSIKLPNVHTDAVIDLPSDPEYKWVGYYQESEKGGNYKTLPSKIDGTLDEIKAVPNIITIGTKTYRPSDALYTWDISKDGDGSILAYYFDGNKKKDGVTSTLRTYDGEVVIVSSSPSAEMINFEDACVTESYDAEYKVWSRPETPYSPISGKTVDDYLTERGFVEIGGYETYTPWSILQQVKGKDIKEINISDKFKVTNGKYLFTGLNKVTSLDLKKIDFTSCSSLNNAFSNMASLTSIDLDVTTTSTLKDLTSMLDYDKALVAVTFGDNFNTSGVTTMSRTFELCSSLTSLNLARFDFSNVQTMSSMFSDCKKLESITFAETINSEDLTNMSFAFKNCHKLSNVSFISKFDTSSVTDVEEMFLNCANLEEINLSDNDFSSVTNAKCWFTTLNDFAEYAKWNYGYDDINNLTPEQEAQLENNRDYYNDVFKLPTGVDESKLEHIYFNPNKTITFNYSNSGYYSSGFNKTFFGLHNLKDLDLSSFNFVSFNSEGDDFYHDYDLGSITLPTKTTDDTVEVNLPEVPDSYWTGYIDEEKVGGTYTTLPFNYNDAGEIDEIRLESSLIKINEGTPKEKVYRPSDATYAWDVSDDGITGKVMAYYFAENSSKGYDGDLIFWSSDPSNKNMHFDYYGYLDLSGDYKLNNNSINDSNYVSYLTDNNFRKLTNNKSIKPWDVLVCFGRNTNKIKHVYVANEFVFSEPLSTDNKFFEYMIDVTSFDVSKLNVSEIESINRMFNTCTSLESIDLSSWNLANVKQMDQVFGGCTNLETVDFGEDFYLPNVVEMIYTFGGCTNLGGGDIFDVSAIRTSDSLRSLQEMFEDCTNLVGVDFGDGFDTSKLESVDMLFYGCTNLEAADLSFIDTTYVYDYWGLFKNCENLESVDLSGWKLFGERDWESTFNPYSHYNYYYGDIFTGCTSLTSIKVPASVDDLVKEDLPFDADHKWEGYKNNSLVGGTYKTLPDTAGGTIDEIRLISNNITIGTKTYRLSDALYTWDVSFSGDGSIYAYYFDGDKKKDGETSTLRTYDGEVLIVPSSSDARLNIFSIGTNKYSDGNYITVDNNIRIDETNYESYLTENGLRGLGTNHYSYTPWNILDAFSSDHRVKSIIASDTFKITSGVNLFEYLPDLSYLDISKVDTSENISTNSMFLGDKKLKVMDLSMLDFSNVVDFTSMFMQCVSLETLTLPDEFVTSSATTLDNMFYGCYRLGSINFESFDTSNVNSYMLMLGNCVCLDEINISNFVFKDSNVNLMYMFAFVPNVHDYMYLMISYENPAITLELFDANVWEEPTEEQNAKLVDMYFMGELPPQSSALTKVTFPDRTIKTNNTAFMFFNQDKLEKLDLSKFEFNDASFVSNMLYGADSLTEVKVPSALNDSLDITLPKITDNYWSGDDGNVYTKLKQKSGDLSKVELKSSLIEVGEGANKKVYKPSEALYTWDISKEGDPAGSVMAYFFDGKKDKDGNSYSREYKGELVFYSNNDTKTVIPFNDFAYLMSGEKWVGYGMYPESFDLRYGQMETILQDRNFIHGYYVITPWSALLSDDGISPVKEVVIANKLNLTSGRYFFAGLSSLEKITGIENINTDNLDLSNTSNMEKMFFDCCKLEGTLDLSSFDLTNAKSMNMMFKNCYVLDGIIFDEDKTISKVTDMNSMFTYCKELGTIDLSMFNTSSTYSMQYMFSGCENLGSVTFGSNFVTSSVSDMTEMFANCKVLTSLDLSGFDISASSVSDFITGCDSLSLIKLPNSMTTTKTIQLVAGDKSYWMGYDDSSKPYGKLNKLMEKSSDGKLTVAKLVHDETAPTVTKVESDKNSYGANKDITLRVTISEELDTSNFADINGDNFYIKLTIGNKEAILKYETHELNTVTGDFVLVFKGKTPDITDEGEFKVTKVELINNGEEVNDYAGNALDVSSLDKNDWKDTLKNLVVNTTGFPISITARDHQGATISNLGITSDDKIYFDIDFSDYTLSPSKTLEEILECFTLEITNKNSSKILKNISLTLKEVKDGSYPFAVVTEDQFIQNKFKVTVDLSDDGNGIHFIEKDDYLGYSVKVSIPKKVLDTETSKNIAASHELTVKRLMEEGSITVKLQRDDMPDKELIYNKQKQRFEDGNGNEVKFQNGDKIVINSPSGSKITYKEDGEDKETPSNELVITIDTSSPAPVYEEIGSYKDGYSINPSDLKKLTIGFVKLIVIKEGNGGTVTPLGTFDIDADEKEIVVTIDSDYKANIYEGNTLVNTLTETGNYVVKNLKKLLQDLTVKVKFVSTKKQEPTPPGGGGGGGGGAPAGPIYTIIPDEAPNSTHKAYMKGYEDNTFRPSEKVSREEVATIVARLDSEFNEDYNFTSFNTFTDANDKWSKNYIGFCKMKDLIHGYEDGSFHPNSVMTRAELATLVNNFLRVQNADYGNVDLTKPAFSDVDGRWYEESVNKLAHLGILNGYEDGTFRGDNPVTRIEVAIVMNKINHRNVTKDIPEEYKNKVTSMFKDVTKDRWFFNDVAEAAVDHPIDLY